MRSKLAAGSFALCIAATTALADQASDEASIRARLQRWAGAFKARDTNTACELFADDLQSVVPGASEGGKEAVCQRLQKILKHTDGKLSYSPDIREVIVSRDLAVVRLTWTLSVTRQGQTTQSREQGMDVFRREADGSWRIVRFIAFTEREN